MNVTIFALPFEDALVEEITEYEHGECEIQHEELECSVVAVGWVNFACEPIPPERACRVIVDGTLEGILGEYACEDCDRLCRDCWSVVMFP